MSGIMSMVLGAKTAIAQAVDAYFNRVTLLLPGDGTNGAQNNTFLDSSSNNFTITRNGNTTQGTFSPFSQTGWSNYFNGSSQLSTVANPNLAFGTGAITFECWINTLSTNNMGMWGTTNESQWTANSYAFNYYNGDIILWNNSTLWSIAVGTLHDGNWHHVAIVRNGTTWQVFADGVSKGTTTTEGSRDLGNNAWRVAIGQVEPSGADTRFFIGYLSNMRVSNTAIYTSNFTPSTTPLTTTSQGVSSSNVKFLSLQSNRFVDNSTNATTFTTYGTPSVQAFSPFAPTAAYSAATNGGSGYFDGSGDYLSVAATSNFAWGTGDFTIETWLYLISSTADSGVFDFRSASDTNQIFLRSTSSTSLQLYINGASQYTFSVSANAFNHIAIVRNSGVLKAYVNGVQVGSVANTTNFTVSSPLSVSAFYNSATANIGAYYSGFRVVKGTAVYTAAFTPPTAPPTAITNTSFLLNFTNAGIIDATGKNVLETVGNAQISTTQSKWGGSSFGLPDTTSYAVIQNYANRFDFGTGDFTIECWLYITGALSGDQYAISFAAAGTTHVGINIYNSGWRIGGFNSYLITGSTGLSQNTWIHVAMVKQNGTLYAYINGTSLGSIAANVSFSATGTVYFGRYYAGTSSNNLTGYIDDLRISKFARYTGNFSVPTAAFPVQ